MTWNLFFIEFILGLKCDDNANRMRIKKRVRDASDIKKGQVGLFRKYFNACNFQD